MTAQRARPKTLPLLLSLALAGCGAGAGGDAGASDDGGTSPDGRVVEITVQRAEPYTESLPAAEGVPERFEPDGERVAIGECHPQLVDPRGGVRLRVAETQTTSQQSQRGDTTFVVHRGYGDYRVDPPASYGLAPGERLRVDCARNVAVGRVGRAD